jgi:hypothetical protein
MPMFLRHNMDAPHKPGFRLLFLSFCRRSPVPGYDHICETAQIIVVERSWGEKDEMGYARLPELFDSVPDLVGRSDERGLFHFLF